MPEHSAGSATRSLPVRSFVIQAALFLVVFTVLAFAGLYWRITTLIDQRVAEQASSYVDLVVDAHEWGSTHGGVWVLKTPEAQSNEYLRKLGVDPETSTASGTRLTLRDPTTMTNELSAISQAKDSVTFRLTSLEPIDPEDAPDPWEREQLLHFATDPTQATHIEQRGSQRVLRLIRPLIVDESCLKCHAKEGFQVGEPRGAISTVVPLGPAEGAVSQTVYVLVGLFALVIVLGGLVGYGLIRRLVTQLNESEGLLRVAATTDALTGIANRRAVFGRLEDDLLSAKRLGSDLGVIILDADHFKQVNDVHGHAAGDALLREMAARLSSQLRSRDTLGRIGGEEFLVVAEETDQADLLGLANRLRSAVAEKAITANGVELAASVSAGIANLRADDSPDSLVARADAALYRAKKMGRNRTEIG